MAYKQIPAPGTSAAPISDRAMGRALVRMLADAVERGDNREALKIVRGATTHFGYAVAHPESVVR